jgi:hypothetical protein
MTVSQAYSLAARRRWGNLLLKRIPPRGATKSQTSSMARTFSIHPAVLAIAAALAGALAPVPVAAAPAAPTAPCTNLVPWMPMAAGGVRLASWDPFGQNQMNQVVDLTCAAGATWTEEASGKTYDLPDQFLTVNQQSGSVTDAAAVVVADTVALAKSLAETFSSSSCGLFTCHSSSKTIQDAINSTYYSDHVIGLVMSQFSSFQLEMLAPSNLSAQAQSWYDSCVGADPTYSVAVRANYRRFAQVFGTHFMVQSTWGGRALLQYEAQRSILDLQGEAAVNAQASGSFGNFVAASGGGGTAVELAAWFTAALTSTSMSFWGGVGQPTPSTWSTWTDSIAQVPSLTQFTVQPISSLLGSCGAAAAFDAFVQDDLDTSVLANVVIPSLQSALAVGLHVTANVTAFADCGSLTTLPKLCPKLPTPVSDCYLAGTYPCTTVNQTGGRAPTDAQVQAALDNVGGLLATAQSMLQESATQILNHTSVANLVLRWSDVVRGVQSTPVQLQTTVRALYDPQTSSSCYYIAPRWFSLPAKAEQFDCAMAYPSALPA